MRLVLVPSSGPPLLLKVRNSFPCRCQSAAGSRWRAEGAVRRHRQRRRSWCQPDEVRTAERQQVWKLRTLHGQETPRTRSSECQQECSGVSVETAAGGRQDQRFADVEEKCCLRSRAGSNSPARRKRWRAPQERFPNHGCCPAPLPELLLPSNRR